MEGMEGGGPSSLHPEVEGNKLDMIPVFSDTSENLKTQVDLLLGKNSSSRYISGDYQYTLRRAVIESPHQTAYGVTIGERDNPRNPQTIYTIIEDRTGEEPTVSIDKITLLPQEEQPKQENASALEAYASGHMKAAKAAYETTQMAEKSEKDMEELTGLPNVSEGEILRLLDTFSSESFQPEI